MGIHPQGSLECPKAPELPRMWLKQPPVVPAGPSRPTLGRDPETILADDQEQRFPVVLLLPAGCCEAHRPTHPHVGFLPSKSDTLNKTVPSMRLHKGYLFLINGNDLIINSLYNKWHFVLNSSQILFYDLYSNIFILLLYLNVGWLSV